MPDPEFQRDPENAAERLLSLTIALLLGGQRGLKKDEVFGAVRDYRFERDKAESEGRDLSALEKKFERDKSTLRASGVPITAEIPRDEGSNNTETRYKISFDLFAWPEELEFTADEMRLLEIANQVWSRAALGVTTNRSMSRVRAMGSGVQNVDLASIAPKLRTHQPSFLPLTNAIENCCQVSFGYRKPDSFEIEKRVVEPWQLYRVGSQWILICFDVQRQEVRNFLLKRIVSKIETLEEEFTTPSEADIAQAKQLLEEHISNQLAVLKIAPGSPANLHFDLEDSLGTELEIHYMDLHLFAEELRELGPDVEVLKPQALADAIRAGLEKVASDHA